MPNTGAGNGSGIVTVGDLRKMLDCYPDDAQILTQVVAGNGEYWMMWLDALHGKDCGFKWNPNPLILKAHHAELKELSLPPAVPSARSRTAP